MSSDPFYLNSSTNDALAHSVAKHLKALDKRIKGLEGSLLQEKRALAQRFQEQKDAIQERYPAATDADVTEQARKVLSKEPEYEAWRALREKDD